MLADVTGSTDAFFIVGTEREPFWTNYFIGDWKVSVPMAMGSDRFGATSLVEYDYLMATGLFSRGELLRMLSVDTPRLLLQDPAVGCVDEGCVASFVALDADPLVVDDAIHNVVTRVISGRIIEIE